MRADIPSYVVHYKGNNQRRALLEYIHDLEDFQNVTWILDYDKEEISYEMYVEHFKADHYEARDAIASRQLTNSRSIIRTRASP